MNPLKILVADDHDVVRRGIRALLEDQPGWEVCAEATNGRQAVEKAKQLKPDVVVLDVTMPELNGLEAARQIRKLFPNVEVLILTMHDSEQLVHEVVKIGARAYVLKSDAGRNLVAAVEALARHEPYFTPRATEAVLHRYREQARGDDLAGARDPLTPREREVAQLLAEGHRTKEVSARLAISVKTAEAHRANIFHKLGVGSIAELVRWAIHTGLIQG